MIFLLLFVLFSPSFAWGQACTHYASPTGTGTACSSGSPCSLAQFFSVAVAGNTLCLKDGTYTGTDYMINPSNDNLSGSSGNPITVRAENDGGAFLDGQFARRPIDLQNNDWFVIDGVDVCCGDNTTVNTATTANNDILRRFTAWDTNLTTGDTLVSIRGTNMLVEDCAGFGRARKIFGSSQNATGGSVTWRRCWGRWEEKTNIASNPKETFTVNYNNWNTIFENIISTWDQGAATGLSEPEGLAFCCRNATGNPETLNIQVLGSIFYLLSTDAYQPNRLVQNAKSEDDFTTLTYDNVVMYIAPGAHTSVKTFRGDNVIPSPANLSLLNSVGVSTAGRDTIGTDWTITNFQEGTTIANAIGAGVSIFDEVQGICFRYQDGTLTGSPLWPWPMNQRILDARALAGRSAIDVTAVLTTEFGAIPAACSTAGVVSQGGRRRW